MAHHYFTNDAQPVFLRDDTPQLKYFSSSDMSSTSMPRPIHRHADLFEICFIADGRGQHFIDGQIYLSCPGDVLVYNRGVLHEDSAFGHASVRMLGLGLTGLQFSGFPAGQLLPRDVSMKIPCGIRAPYVRSLFEAIGAMVQDSGAHSGEIARMLANAILLTVQQLSISSVQAETSREAALAAQLRNYIDAHFSEEITLDGLAAQFGITRFHAGHVFHDHIGYSPIQYLLRRRIGEAQSLLVFTDRSMTDIALTVGFHSSSYFSRTFSKVVGVSPASYRSLSMNK